MRTKRITERKVWDSLREARISRKITHQRMADAIGLKRANSYSLKELGYVTITIDEAKAIADVLEMSIEDVFFAEASSQ